MTFMRKYCQSLFIYLIFATIIFVYFVTTYLVCLNLFQTSFTTSLFIFLFTVSTIMMVWSLMKTMFTDPGKVPQNWGFFLNDPDQKKRRFCLICHIFKPERCHHCSACNRCVLNMDHHCPWINNCVGFQNRKFFLQMLMYVILTTFLGAIVQSIGIYKEFEKIYAFLQGGQNENFLQTLMVLVSFIICCLVFGLISMFFKFHIELVLSNRTTIENLDRKRQEETGEIQKENSLFDIGQRYNLLQVFGMNKFLWFVPLSYESGRPCGDGILWPKKNRDKLDDLQQSPHFTSPKTNDNSQLPIYNVESNNWRVNSAEGSQDIPQNVQLFQNQQFGFVGAQPTTQNFQYQNSGKGFQA